MSELREFKNPFIDMVIAPKSVDEILSPAIRRALRISSKSPKVPLTKAKRISERRIMVMTDYIIRRLRDICYTTPFISELHPFYRDLAYVLVDVDKFRKSLAKVKGAINIIIKIRNEYLKAIRNATDKEEVRKARKAFIGRIASLLEDLEEDLITIREAQLALRRLPSINPYLKTIVVAGPPNVGKSSFVKRVSTAEPEIREYPFTTKSLILGHIIIEDLYIQIIDTPGLLDRPFSERNKIELQAILALKHLANVIIFLFDPSLTCGYPLEHQVNVYNDVKQHFSNVPIIPVMNKVDIAKEEEKEKLRSMLNEDLIEMSVLTGQNVNKVLKMALSNLRLPEYYLKKAYEMFKD